MTSFKDLWNLTVENLNGKFSPNVMELWINPAVPVEFDGNAAVISVESPFHREMLLSKYSEDIKRALFEVSGIEMDLKIILPETNVQPSEDGNEKKEILSEIENRLVSEYTFDSFVVGESNRHAYAACYNVAKKPFKAYNPLFVYGNSGLGKTHLLKAIKSRINELYPSLSVLYINCETFVNELIEHLQNKTMTEFREKYRDTDVLIIDDIQFISGKVSTQTEFFYTFNTLYESGKQIIISSDRPPKDISELEERLKSRFESGLITDIVVPEYELKVAILRQKAASNSVNIPDDVIDYIATHIKHNIRQLEGVVKKLHAFSFMSDAPINISAAQSAIKDITNDGQPIPDLVEKVIQKVSVEFQVSPDDIKSNKRQATVTLARQVAMYIIRDITSLSNTDIGKFFSNRDHATVFHSIEKIEDKIEENQSFSSQVNLLIQEINN